MSSATATNSTPQRAQATIAVLLCAFALPSAPRAAPAEQYKKHNRNAVALISDGKYDRAIRQFQQQLQHYEQDMTHHHDVYPADSEALFGLAVAHARKGDIAKAVDYVRQALDSGLPMERFLSGPRDMLRPLTDSEQFQELFADYDIQLLHGPMLSNVTHNSAQFWMRTVDEVPVEVKVSRSRQMGDIVPSGRASTNKARDYTAVIAVSGLQPDTAYFYQLTVDGERIPSQWSFRTYSPPNEPTSFRVGFGGGAGFTPWHEHIWTTIRSHSLPAFLLLGDNVYIDHPKYPAVQRYCYYRRQCRPEYRKFTAGTAIYAIWDDHDFTTNDSGGGPAIDRPPWKIPVWRTFKNNWNNPYYAGGESQPGCWFHFSIADVDFFLLDGRYYRTGPNVENPSMLGPAQKQWLFERLKASDATFKVIASPVPWAYGSKPGSKDPWQGYKAEREQIFSFIEDNGIDGVVLISADRHRSDVWKIERNRGYDLYEFESSKLTNVHTHGIMPGSLYGYSAKCSFGILRFDTARPDPRLSYQIWNIDNELVYQLSLPRSQLTVR